MIGAHSALVCYTKFETHRIIKKYSKCKTQLNCTKRWQIKTTHSKRFKKKMSKNTNNISIYKWNRIEIAYVMLSVLNWTMILMKFSRITTARIDFQSDAFSPSSKQIDSNANLTIAGGLAIERTSTKCCLRIDLTAIVCILLEKFYFALVTLRVIYYLF